MSVFLFTLWDMLLRKSNIYINTSNDINSSHQSAVCIAISATFWLLICHITPSLFITVAASAGARRGRADLPIFSNPSVGILRSYPVFTHITFDLPYRAPLTGIQGQHPPEHLHTDRREPFPLRWHGGLRRTSAPVCKLLVEIVAVVAALPGEEARKDTEKKNSKGPGV